MTIEEKHVSYPGVASDTLILLPMHKDLLISGYARAIETKPCIPIDIIKTCHLFHNNIVSWSINETDSIETLNNHGCFLHGPKFNIKGYIFQWSMMGISVHNSGGAYHIAHSIKLISVPDDIEDIFESIRFNISTTFPTQNANWSLESLEFWHLKF